jgi:alpha-L-rhamnosidase
VLRGDCGTTVTLTFSEVLTLEGEINLAYLEPVGKDRAQRDEVVLSGSQEGDCFEPLFTIHGFRYVALTGLQYLPALSEVEAAIVSSQLSSPSSALAEFECSDPRLNQLFRNTVWSFLGNFTDTATDCPTRERSGWTGDLQVFGSTAMLLARDVQSFLRRYLRNLQAEQWPDGRIPPFIPSGDSTFGGVSWLSRLTASSVGWGDVNVLLPWQMYLHFGDTHVLERQYASMERWVGFLTGLASNRRSWRRWLRAGPAGVEQYIVDTGFHWGEWLRPGETGLLSMVPNLFVWPSAAVPTAFLAESSRILSKIAGVLGHPQDEASYRDLAAHVRRAWAASFVRDGGRRIGHDKQDDYVRAVTYDLVSGVEKEAAVGRLAELVQQTGYHLGTGFLSTASLVPTLCENGHSEHAFRLLLQTTPPSWLYAVERGATTIWESWEGCSADGRAVLSQNHYALGAVVDWLLRGLVGINAVSPGWRHVRIAPHIGGGITHARASVNTNFGRLSCAWRLDGVTTGADVWIELQVPPGTTADVQVADSSVYSVASGAHRLQLSDGRWTAHEP